MALYDASKLRPIEAGARIGPDAVDPGLLGLAREYRRRITERFVLLGRGDIDPRRIRDDRLFASVKIDGQFSFIYADPDDAFVFNYSGRVITGLPALADVRAALAGMQRAVLPCELYYPRPPHGRSRAFEVASCLRLGGGGGDLGNLHLAVFDIGEIEGESWFDRPYAAVDARLREMLPAGGRFHRVESEPVELDGLRRLYARRVEEEGHEGIVARSPEKLAYKIKPRHDLDVAVIGFARQVEEERLLASLLTAMMRPDGTFQVLGPVGGGFGQDEREAWVARLEPEEVPSEYKETDRNHTLFAMVHPRHVVEVSVGDLLTEDSRGQPLPRAALRYEAKRGYQVLLPEPFVTAISPVYERRREDKEVTPEDLRLGQLRPHVDLDNLEAAARTPATARGELLRREIFTKQLRGALMVRKFLAWKTNKEALDPSYPAYVFCFVDYSPGRADPLKREVKITDSRQQLEAIFAATLKAEVKQGWKKAG